MNTNNNIKRGDKMNFKDYQQTFYAVLKLKLDDSSDDLRAMTETIYLMSKEFPAESDKYLQIISDTIQENFPRNGREI